MGQQLRLRKQNTVQFSAGNKVLIDITRSMILRDLRLELTGQLTVAGAGNTAAATKLGDEWAVVKKIELISDGSNVIRSISGRALRWLNALWHQALPNMSAALGDGATANPSFDSSLVLPLTMHFPSFNPMDTAIDTAKLKNLQLAITWGTYTDINGGATGFTANPAVVVSSFESFDPAHPHPIYDRSEVYELPQVAASTNSDWQIALPVGKLYRAITVITDTNGDESATFLNNIRLSSGSTVFVDLDADLVNAMTFKDLPRWSNGADYGKFRSSKASAAGIYHLDLTPDGYLTEAVDTRRLSELILHLDVTGGAANNVLVIPHTVIIVPRPAPPKK